MPLSIKGTYKALLPPTNLKYNSVAAYPKLEILLYRYVVCEREVKMDQTITRSLCSARQMASKLDSISCREGGDMDKKHKQNAMHS